MMFDRRTSRRDFVLSALAGAESRASSVVLSMQSGARLHMSETEPRAGIHPGSTLKPLVATCLVQAGAAVPVRCSGALVIGNRRLACSHPRSDTPVDLVTALAWSCNEFFAVNAPRAGAPRLCDTLRKFGLDVAYPATTNQLSLLAVGEWGVLTGALELASACRRLALSNPDARIREGLKAAARYGTARLARPVSMEICGKTGTSPNRSHTGTYALFAGWAPADRPRLCVAVIAEGGHGGADAAPIARKLIEKYA